MKILLFNFNNILTGVADELVKRGHTLIEVDTPGNKEGWKAADVIVVWNETALAGWRSYIEEFQKAGKRVILVQHGRRGTSRIYPPFNEKLISDVVCVWSENDRKRLISVGTDPSKIVVTGTPVMKNVPNPGQWFHWGRQTWKEPYNVVFSPEHWDVDVTENYIIADELRKLVKKQKGLVKVTTKILKNHQDPMMYDNPVVSDRNALDHMSIVFDTLKRADAVVAVSESTFELLAEAMDIPVIIADIWIPKACDGDDRYKEYKHEYSNACTLAKLDKLNETIMKELDNPKRLSKERAQIAIDDGGFDIADPIGNIIKVIEND